MPEYASIKIKKATKNSADRLMKKYEMNGLDFYHAMVNYFDKTGVNPKDMKILSPAEELKKFRDTIISFMRKQEKDFILPIFGKMDVTIARFMHYIENEAPKNSDKATLDLSEQKFDSKEEDIKEFSIPETHDNDLKIELEQEKQKIRNIKTGMLKIFNSSEFKSTGLNKKIVIEMPQNEFEDIKQMIKNS